MLHAPTLSMTRRWANDPAAHWVLFVWSVLEAIAFPIPPDAFLLPCMLLQPKRSWRLATICMVGQCLGGLVGFMLGRYAMPTLIEPYLHALGWWPAYQAMQVPYQQWGSWLVLSTAFTPLPYKLVAPLSGAAGLSLPIFLLASVAGHGLRVYLLAFACNRYGNDVVRWLRGSRRHLLIGAGLAILVLSGCWLWMK